MCSLSRPDRVNADILVRQRVVKCLLRCMAAASRRNYSSNPSNRKDRFPSILSCCTTPRPDTPRSDGRTCPPLPAPGVLPVLFYQGASHELEAVDDSQAVMEEVLLKAHFSICKIFCRVKFAPFLNDEFAEQVASIMYFALLSSHVWVRIAQVRIVRMLKLVNLSRD